MRRVRRAVHVAHGPLCARALLRGAQRRPKIVDQVLGVFQADREPDHAFADARFLQRRRIELGVCRRGGMDHQRLGVTDIGEMRKQLQPLYEAPAGLAAALDVEAEHRARAQSPES